MSLVATNSIDPEGGVVSMDFQVLDLRDAVVVEAVEAEAVALGVDAILQVEGLDYFAGGPQDIAQSMGHPGEPDHPVSVEAFEAACAKVRASGKHMIADHIETIDVFEAVYGAGVELLERYGRQVGTHL